MANIGIFDVLGPIMIGPSSSHTAGAARLGKIARTIVNKPIKKKVYSLSGLIGGDAYRLQQYCNTGNSLMGNGIVMAMAISSSEVNGVLWVK